MSVRKNFQIFSIFLSIVLILSVSIPANAQTEPPIKQMKNGTPIENILCKTELELVIRNNGMPACVRSETADKMTDLGIAVIPVKITETKNEIKTVPASNMSIVNFYITDQDLNLERTNIEIVPAKDLFEFTINGIPIEGPETIIETGRDTGQFYVKLELPDTINNRPLSQDDVILIKYLDESDYAGEERVIVQSVKLTSTFAKVETSGGGSRIGHEFTVRIYEPDANRDSKDEDKIPLSLLEYKGKGGIKTTLANPRFDANSSYLIETGPNTNTFEVKIKIPRELDGKIVHIGDWYEIKYIDRTTPSETDEKIILKGRIG